MFFRASNLNLVLFPLAARQQTLNSTSTAPILLASSTHGTSTVASSTTSFFTTLSSIAVSSASLSFGISSTQGVSSIPSLIVKDSPSPTSLRPSTSVKSPEKSASPINEPPKKSSVVLPTGPIFAEPSAVTLPTVLPCNDPSYNPSPENWILENVDEKLRESQHLWAGKTSFVEYIASVVGQHGQQCGIGHTGTCTVPDCNALQVAGGPKWAYFVSIAIVRLDTFLNMVHSGIQAGKSDLSLVVGRMSGDFFPFHPKPTKPNIWPWISSTLTVLLTAIPAIFFGEVGAVAGASAAAFVQGGISTIQPYQNDPNEYYIKTMWQLGDLLKDLSFNTTEALDNWSEALFNGKPDNSGKTILDYLHGGRFTLDYNLTSSQIQKSFFQLMVSHVVDNAWNSTNTPSRTFIMCTTGNAPCTHQSRFVEGGQTCCLYSLNSKGKYISPPGLDALGNATFGIAASDITAGSLHSNEAQGLFYDKTKTANDIEASLLDNTTTKAFDEGVKFQGAFTVPVCYVGSNANWVSDYKFAKLPCCCGSKNSDGTTCSQTNDFITAAHLAGYGKFCKKCKAQYPGFVCPKVKKGDVKTGV